MVCAMLNLRLLVGVAGASSSGEMQPTARFVSWNQCGSQAANLGTRHKTASECAAAAWNNAACGSREEILKKIVLVLRTQKTAAVDESIVRWHWAACDRTAAHRRKPRPDTRRLQSRHTQT